MTSQPRLAVVIPTFNEVDNVGPLVDRLSKVLANIAWEAIFVDDDSPDGTATEVRRLSRQSPEVRCIQRINRRGLASACIEGMLSTSAPYIAVMDADMQHDETLLPAMLDLLKEEDLDIVVGSRFAAGGGVGSFPEKRVAKTALATRLSRLVVPADLKDPMSGFFVITREAFEGTVHHLSGIGFKILMDLFASSPEPLRYRELSYTFGRRRAGESKLDNQALWDYGMLLLDKLAGRYIPVRFVAFTIVGGLGIFVHMAVLAAMHKGLGFGFVVSQALATLIAMTANYTLNNIVTYRDLALTGWAWLRGWFSFVLACSIGALANVGVAVWLFERDSAWFVAGLAGILVGAVWNYAVTSTYTWRADSRRRVTAPAARRK